MNSMEILLLVLFSLANLRTAEGKECSTGFHKYRRSCYWFSTIKGNFGYAMSICKQLRSHLAIITSRNEDAFLRGYAKRRGGGGQYFLGATDLGLEGWWTWSDGQKMSYTNWGPIEPNNNHKIEHCLTMSKSQGYKWNDSDCHVNLYFICEHEL